MIAIMIILSAGGFYGPLTGTFELREYPNMQACVQDKPRVLLQQQEQGMTYIRMLCSNQQEKSEWPLSTNSELVLPLPSAPIR